MVPLPPILELYVVWHPTDSELGERAATALIDHFHGPAYAGLAGGAVEVYIRSAVWQADDLAPRPLPIMESLPAQLPSAQLTAVVPILGWGLAEAVEAGGPWHRFMVRLIRSVATASSAADGSGAGIYALPESGLALNGYQLNDMIGPKQWLPPDAATDTGLLGREVAQAIAQDLRRTRGATSDESRIKVFVSHTKQLSAAEVEAPTSIVEDVRTVIRRTHLSEFFDAQDIQVQADWAGDLEREASRSALLMVRTDLYSTREWTQREVLIAKQHDLPVVALFATTGGDERGSFLMDHVPVYPCTIRSPDKAIERALNRLVDETLKRALWARQTVYLQDDGFDWMPGSAPELVTLVPWLSQHRENHASDPHVWILHPDPPLGPPELEIVKDLCALAGFDRAVEVHTPRTFAIQGGSV